MTSVTFSLLKETVKGVGLLAPYDPNPGAIGGREAKGTQGGSKCIEAGRAKTCAVTPELR
jgi:hypothetical protein